MKFYSTLIVLVFILKNSTADDLCLDDGTCARKCCPDAQIYDFNASVCRKSEEPPVRNESSLNKVTSCPGGIWLETEENNQTAAGGHLECVEDVFEGGNLTRKALTCFNESFDDSDRYSVLDSKIDFNKCCSNDKVYDIDAQHCQHVNETDVSQYPLVHFVSNNQSVKLSNENFNETIDFLECPDGFIAKHSVDFMFYEDGTVNVRNADRSFEAGDFCIGSTDRSDSSFVVRFCSPDPCQANNCVRKCCPEGFFINEETHSCDPTADRFNVTFQSENGSMSSVSIAFRSGMPVCPEDFIPLDPINDPNELFYILPNGSMYTPVNHQYHLEYCVDDFAFLNTTNKKALICDQKIAPPPEDKQLAMRIFPYLMFISALFLIATILTIYPDLNGAKTSCYFIIVCYCSSLAVALFGLGIIQLNNNIPNLTCLSLGIVVHFSFLAAFTWSNALSYDICGFRPIDHRMPPPYIRNRIRRRCAFYSIYAWGVPLIFVVTGQVLQNRPDLPEYIILPNYGNNICWFPDKASIFTYLHGPVTLILLSNVVFFCLTANKIYQLKRQASLASHSVKRENQGGMIAFSLFILMGITWVTEVISWSIEGSAYYFVPTDVLNCLTGVLVFIVVACKKRGRRRIRERLQNMGQFAQGLTTSIRNSMTFRSETNTSALEMGSTKRNNQQ